MIVFNVCFNFTGLKLLGHQLRQSQRAAFADGTRQNINCKLRAFLLFCNAFRLRAFPASVETVCLFAQFLSRTFKNVVSIKSYISGVKLVHLIAGLEFPHLSALELKLAFRGIARLNPFIPRQALPITPQILLKMLSVMDVSSQLHATLWCAFLLAFFLFARKSNMVPPSRVGFDSSKHLCRSDISVGRDCLVVSLKWSKTNQAKDRVVLVPLVEIPGSPLCPRTAFLNMVARVPGSLQGPAFLVPSKLGLQSLTHSSFTNSLRHLLRLAGLEPKGYSGHSFRRGGASFALGCGVAGELIMNHGDWRSNAYLRYLDHSVQDRALVSRVMADACVRL